MRLSGLLILGLLFFVSCVPKEAVVLRTIENVHLTAGNGVNPILQADASFYNPNNLRMRVKKIKLDVFVDGKKSALIDQNLKSVVRSKTEFTLPLEVQISLKEIGLLDALLGIIGGKKYSLHYVGHIRVKVKGIPLRIPVDYSREVKLRL